VPVARIRRKLLDWYSANQRNLPWRSNPSPYAIWVSEVMVQQTQIATAIPYFERWMRRFPSVVALAESSEDEALRLWQGLGYYSRARALHRAARRVVDEHGGRLPAEVASLRALPGVGQYTAGAIASIAFGLPEPAVDGNVARVLARLFALRGDPSRAPLHPVLWKCARQLVPRRRAADFNQALMELGAKLCTPTRPQCTACPLRPNCLAAARGIATRLPDRRERRPAVSTREVAALLARAGRWLVVQRPDDASRWARLWTFPTTAVRAGENCHSAAQRALRETVRVETEVEGVLVALKHSVTRHRIVLEACLCRAATGRPAAAGCAGFAWKRPSELNQLAMPTPHRRIAQTLQASRSRRARR
jgi:A/G-specific adenine glycosylase